jgi:hypothetical protein
MRALSRVSRYQYYAVVSEWARPDLGDRPSLLERAQRVDEPPVVAEQHAEVE